MNLDEYASYDGLGLGELVAKGEVTPKELARTAAAAIEAVNREPTPSSRPTPIASRASTRPRSATARSAACRS